jgi:T5SS/PEP-CTERM-associated repeat protein/autotransporter-associated beta strand protein
LLFGGFASPKAIAATIDWNGGNGSWFVSTNWLNNVMPTGSDTVFINSGNPQVMAPGAVAAEVRVGNILGGRLTIGSGGTLTDTDGLVGVFAAGIATVSGSGSTWTNNGVMRVGIRNEGTLSIAAGGAVTSNGGGIGDFSLSSDTGIGTVTISGNGSKWNNSGALSVGVNGGRGTLTVDNGGMISSNGGTIGGSFGGSDTASVGMVTISGGSWINSGSLLVGGVGSGKLTINSGAFVNNTTATIGSVGTDPDNQVTVDGINSMWINSGDVTIGQFAPGTLNIVNNGIVSVNNGSGTITLAKLNSGFTAAINIGNGGETGTLDAGTITTGLGQGAVNFNHTGFAALSANLTGNLSISKLGAGTRVLTGTNTYTGTTTISAGTLQIGNGGTFGTLGTGNVVNNSTLSIQRDGAITVSNTISGSGNLQKGGPGTLILSGVNTYAGGTTITGGYINFASLSNFGPGTITCNGGGLQWAAGNTVDISGRLSAIGASGVSFDTNGNDVTLATGLNGSGGIHKFGPGTITLTSTNNYAGGTTINEGTLKLGSNLGVPWNTAYTINGGTLDLNNYSFAASSFSGTGGTVALGSATLTVNQTTNTTYSGAITGAGGLTKQGGGKLSLSGPGITYTGNTSVLTGTLEILNNTVFSSPILINQPGTLLLNIADDVKLLQGVSGYGNMDVTGTAKTARLAGDNSSFNGTFTLPNTARGMMWSGPNAGSASASWILSGEFAAIETGAGDTTTKLGTLTGTNPATKLTTFGGSGVKTLEVGELNTASFFAGIISDNSQGGGGTGVMALKKVGTAPLFLSGANNYTGPTNILAGTLEIQNNFSFNSPIFVDASAALTLNIANDVRLLKGVSGGGNIDVTGTGATARLAGDNSGFTGSFTLPTTARGMMWSSPNAGSALASWNLSGEFGYVETGAGNTTARLGALSGTNPDTRIASFGGSGVKTLEVGALGINTTFAGNIVNSESSGGGTGTLALKKVGAGTLTLSGTVAHTGGTTVDAGTLLVTGSIRGTTVNPGGTLAGTGTIIGDVNMVGGTLSPGDNGIGDLHVLGAVHLSDASTLRIELGPVLPDQVHNTGALTYDGTLLLSLADGYQPSIGEIFQFFSYPSAPHTGTFDTIVFDQPGYSATYDYSIGFLTVVPEPSACALIGVALSGLALRRRKAKSTTTPFGLIVEC